jgi:competence transcription factor ComK
VAAQVVASRAVLSSTELVSKLVPCSQTPVVYVPPLMSEIKFPTHADQQPNYSLIYSNFYVFRQ